MSLNSKKTMEIFTTGLNRRTFIKKATVSIGLSLFCGSVVADSHCVSANKKINLACVGIGNMGGRPARHIGDFDLVNVVALCDVDMGSAITVETLEEFPDAKRFRHFRKMFDKVGNQIDAVMIGTPDHSHFPIAMMAMGKHVYIKKPLVLRWLLPDR